MTEAKKRAKREYAKKCSKFLVWFYPKDKELFEHLQQQDNKNGYILDLIRKDMAGQ